MQQSIQQPQVPSKQGEVLHWRGLYGSASSLAVANLIEQLGKTNKPVIYVCSDAQHVQQIHRELSFYLTHKYPIFTFPDWECLPYDRVSPHADIISQRLLALHQLPTLQSGVLIIPITALIQRLAPTTYIDAHTFDLAVNDDFDTEQFR